MNIELTKLPESRVALTIELTPDEVEQALDRTYKQLVQRVTIPGFRKGRAPRPIVERMVGPDLFLHEATEEAVRWGYRKAIDQEQLTPINEADVDAGDEHSHLHPGESFQFQATVSVRPKVKLPDYQAIQVEREVLEVTDQDVDDLLEQLRERQATLEPTVQAAGFGDVLTMNVAARVNGEEVINRDSSDFELVDESNPELPGHPTFPGLAPELVGAVRGDIREVTISLPENYANPEWAGKSMSLRVLIKETKRKVLPTLDDSFAQSVSEAQDLTGLKDLLRTNLNAEREHEADERLVRNAIEEVSSRSFVEIPPLLIEEEIEREMTDMRSAFELRRMSLDTYFQVTGRSEIDMRRDMREGAAQSVKTSLVLGAVADQEKIDVSKREVDVALDEMLRSLNSSEAERRRYRTSSGVRSNIRTRLRRQRAIQRLVEVVTGGERISLAAAEAGSGPAVDGAEEPENADETVAVEVSG